MTENTAAPILVTGSAGHLGEALIRVLRGGGRQTIGTDILPSFCTDFVGSITDRDFVRGCLKDAGAIIHTATLHKPHVATHTRQDFVETNITGTLNLLEEATLAGIRTFVFTSTTSLFGDALTPPAGAPAIWVTEDLKPVPKNIYGVTKTAAEDLCQLFHRNHGLNCLILRTSRFFPEMDDNKQIREGFSDDNTKANEFTHRRVEIEDVVSAHLLALNKAGQIGFGRYIISATSPFARDDLGRLAQNAPAVTRERVPDYEAVFEHLGWRMFPEIKRVYVNDRARRELGWQPKYDFGHIIGRLSNGESLLSPLAGQIGQKGYHDEEFEDGPYPVETS